MIFEFRKPQGLLSFVFGKLKKPSPISSFFFHTFWRFCYHKKAHIFLITHVEFYSYKVFRLEDINENMSGYGNHIKSLHS